MLPFLSAAPYKVIKSFVTSCLSDFSLFFFFVIRLFQMSFNKSVPISDLPVFRIFGLAHFLLHSEPSKQCPARRHWILAQISSATEAFIIYLQYHVQCLGSSACFCEPDFRCFALVGCEWFG
jgi:hypothetical protein